MTKLRATIDRPLPSHPPPPQRYGPARGAVLTAWRLLRCNPITGGRLYEYDPPRWFGEPPPPPL